MLHGLLQGVVTTDLSTHWDLRLEELVADKFFLINFRALVPAYKRQVAPLGISNVARASGGYKKPSKLYAAVDEESYEFTLYLENTVTGDNILRITIPGSTGWAPY